jgi:hypothetical protein
MLLLAAGAAEPDLLLTETVMEGLALEDTFQVLRP